MNGDACSAWCGYCGRCTAGDGREGEPRGETQTEAQFQAALTRAEADSLAMRARWAAQDARKRGEVA